MTNLTNTQQTEVLNTQNRQQSMLTDQAAANAAAQFNASSENQQGKTINNDPTKYFTKEFNGAV